mgnify:CR=1 FL=1
MIEYHDTEWGRPIVGAVDHFERLALESFQAGLSWSTILHKRPAFRLAFRGFDPAVVAAFGDDDRARLMADAGIVRNRSKIDVTIVNARLFLGIVTEFGAFETYLATIVPPPPRRLPPTATAHDRFMSLALAVRDRMQLRWMASSLISCSCCCFHRSIWMRTSALAKSLN